MNTSWSEEEDVALQGMPHRTRVLYLQCLRRYMDYETGVVGRVRKVSLQMFREVLEVRAESGRNAGVVKPTDKELRVSLEQLERVGLIKRLPKASRFSPMTFHLPLAITGKKHPENIGQEKGKLNTAKERAREEHGVTSSPDTNRAVEQGKSESMTKGIHPVTGSQDPPLSWQPQMHSVSERFSPSETLSGRAKRAGIASQLITQELEPFIAHHQSKATLSANWDAEFFKWLLRAKKFAQQDAEKRQRSMKGSQQHGKQTRCKSAAEQARESLGGTGLFEKNITEKTEIID